MAHFLESTMKLTYCSPLCHIVELVESQTTDEQRVQYVYDFSDATDALVVELSHSLDAPEMFPDILAKYSNEAVYVLYARQQLITNYIQHAAERHVFNIPTEDSEFFQFALIEALAFLT